MLPKIIEILTKVQCVTSQEHPFVITKRSILDIAAALDPPLEILEKVKDILKVNNIDTTTTLLNDLGVFFVNFEHISHLFLEFLFMALNNYIFAGIFFMYAFIGIDEVLTVPYKGKD